ncbi:hypothetical protein [Allosaccharopolyspora coralli]|nr:hypothetical protein [Allosaccharopolyspora coralli]
MTVTTRRHFFAFSSRFPRATFPTALDNLIEAGHAPPHDLAAFSE